MNRKVDTRVTAIFLQVQPETVRDYIRCGRLKAKKDSTGQYQIDMGEIVELIRVRREQPWPRPSLVIDDLLEEFFVLLKNIGQEPTEDAQLKLMEIATAILATEYNTGLSLAGEEARKMVRKWIRILRGNPNFVCLELVGDLFNLLRRMSEQRAA